MDSFLSELNTAGKHDSQGAFTINTNKAQIKLAQYQLGKLEDLSKLLILMATSNECRTLTVEGHSVRSLLSKTLHSTCISFSPLVLSHQDISVVGFEALKQDAPPRLRYLATVLSTLCAHHEVHLMSGAESCDISLKIGPQEIVETEPEKNFFCPQGTVLVVKERLLDWLEPGLRQSGRWCPCEIRLVPDGAPLPQGLSAYRDLPTAWGIYALNAGPLVKGSSVIANSIQNIPNNPALPQVWAMAPSSEARKIGISIVVKGLALPLHLPVKIPELCGAISADHLSLDLSYQNVVDNAAYQRVLEEVEASIRSLLRVVLSRERRFDEGTEARLYSMITQLARPDEEGELLNLLERSTRKMRPGSDPVSLSRLQARLSRSSPGARKQLFLEFRQTIHRQWQEGRLAQAVRFQEAELFLRKSVNFETSRQEDILELFRLLNSEKMRPIRSIEGLQKYLRKLLDWAEAKIPPNKGLAGIHPTWNLPFLLDICDSKKDWSDLEELFKEGLPAWLKLWTLLMQKDAEQAICLVRETPEFDYGANRMPWDDFFWFHCRGILTWKKAVRLRAELSCAHFDASAQGKKNLWESLHRAALPEPLIDTQEELTQAITHHVLLDYPQASFWPRFFTIQFLGRKRVDPHPYRAIWPPMVIKTLLGHLLSEPEADPLGLPFI